MIACRQATEKDVSGIRELFLAVYGQEYPHQEVYDEQRLKRSIYSEGYQIFVAEDIEQKKLFGTAAVVFDVGSFSDLLGEFGRLVVHPDARNQGIAALLMEARLESIKERLHVAIVEPRTLHPYSQKNVEAYGFAPVGFQPFKGQLLVRESLTLHVRYFGDALSLRNNHPRVIPEAAPIAHLALENVGIQPDYIVDELSSSYAPGNSFTISTIASDSLPGLLRIERGRVRRREIFGNLRLHYGMAKILQSNATYLVAKDGTQIIGAIGFSFDEISHNARASELIFREDSVVRPLLRELVFKCRKEWGVDYIEIDVSTMAPRMQRTLMEEGFVPVAYIPAMVFHDVERLDIVRMVKLLKKEKESPIELTPRSQGFADHVLQSIKVRAMTPRLREVMSEIPLFCGLDSEQLERVAAACNVENYEPGDALFHQNEQAQCIFLLLKGQVSIRMGAPSKQLGAVECGDVVGEISFLSDTPHSADAVALTPVEVAFLDRQNFQELIRQRPNIGLVLYRNLAMGLGQKLRRMDAALGAL